jgi:hypothetical protein
MAADGASRSRDDLAPMGTLLVHPVDDPMNQLPSMNAH